MAEEKNMNAENAVQLGADELAQASGGVYKHIKRFISCNKDYCGYVQTDGKILYVPCERCHHAMHFENHTFIFFDYLGYFYCDKCDVNLNGNRFEFWNGTEQELIASANEAL